jgi:hypothetical protein
MTFLPNNYQAPTPNSNYFKPQKGVNKVRVMDEAIVGYLYWNVDNKPVRQAQAFKLMPPDIRIEGDGNVGKIKHFWAFPVYDYADGQIKIWEVTQSSIQGQLKQKVENRNGIAINNDIVLTRTGDGLLTEYEVDMLDATPTPKEAVQAYINKPVNLEALFEGADPFAVTQAEPAPISVEDIPF